MNEGITRDEFPGRKQQLSDLVLLKSDDANKFVIAPNIAGESSEPEVSRIYRRLIRLLR
jgi:hypothetical protein